MRGRFLFAVILALLGAGGLSAQPGLPATQDAVLIVSTSPTSFEDGREALVEVTVAYDLTSADEAEIDLSSNGLKAQQFRPIGRTSIKRGNGTATVAGKMTPRYWGSITPAKIAVHLWRKDESLSGRRVLAADDTRIPVARRERPETDSLNPNPSEIYDDTIAIKSISPEHFIAGQATEVTVTVAYELLSREEGEITFGASQGRGSGYGSIDKARVKIGKGEIVMTARLVPTRTGRLPFTKLFVNIAEFPHREKFSPLATDSLTVEVR